MSGSNRTVTEQELIEPALRAASARGGFISTQDLIIELEELFLPKGRDAEILDGRSDTYFSQKVRNLVSHRNSKTSMISRGLAIYDEKLRGIRITSLGKSFLDEIDNQSP
jgi:hypothetical protein